MLWLALLIILVGPACYSMVLTSLKVTPGICPKSLFERNSSWSGTVPDAAVCVPRTVTGIGVWNDLCVLSNMFINREEVLLNFLRMEFEGAYFRIYIINVLLQ